MAAVVNMAQQAPEMVIPAEPGEYLEPGPKVHYPPKQSEVKLPNGKTLDLNAPGVFK